MTRDEFKSDIKSKIDELTPQDGGLTLFAAPGNTANNPVELYIEQFLDEAAKQVMLIAPIDRLTLTEITSGITYDITNSKAVITIPSDFLRIGSIYFPGWERTVFTLTYPGDSQYKNQLNKWTRGGASKPVPIVSRETTGVSSIVCYGVTSGTGAKVFYVKEVVAESAPAMIDESISWYCASLVLQVFNKEALSKMALSRFETLLKSLS